MRKRQRHGFTHHRLYACYYRMRHRCENPADSSYERYGGRGIKVCGEWKNDIMSFINWGIENGYKEGLSIDRIDNAFIVHRNNQDFQRLSKEMFKWKEDHDAYKGTNVIEIAKDRHNGHMDVFIPLWYEKETKRLKNAPAEMIQYGWDKSDGFGAVDDDEIPFT